MDIDDYIGFFKFLGAVTIGFTLIVLFVLTVALPITWFCNVKEAEVYNRLCKPVTPITAYDLWWISLSTKNCNVPLQVKEIK